MAVKFKFSHMKKVIVDQSLRVWRAQNYLFWKKLPSKWVGSKLDQTWSNFDQTLIKLDQTWSNLIKLDQTWSNLIKLDYFLNTLALVMWHHRDMRQIMQKALFHAHIDSFLVISVFYDHHYSSSNRDAITCMILGVQKQTCETPSFTIKQTNKIVKLKCFMMIIILLQIVMQSRDTGCPKANWWNDRFSNKKKDPANEA